ncbi:hypothetical protein PMAYCL1PPCAC_10137, partial [Pristionchus mayeri]
RIKLLYKRGDIKKKMYKMKKLDKIETHLHPLSMRCSNSGPSNLASKKISEVGFSTARISLLDTIIGWMFFSSITENRHSWKFLNTVLHE